MRIRRDIVALPVRSGAETWAAIVELITSNGTIDRGQLEAAGSIIATTISDEQETKRPLIVSGNGPKLLIYCKYGLDALEVGAELDPLAFNPTGGAWRLSAPAADEDVNWMNSALEKRAPRITVRSHDEPEWISNELVGNRAGVEINWKAIGNN